MYIIGTGFDSSFEKHKNRRVTYLIEANELPVPVHFVAFSSSSI